MHQLHRIKTMQSDIIALQQGGGGGDSFSAANFEPSGNQTGLTGESAVDLEMMVQDFQDDSDWTVDNNTTLSSNRTGRYRFSFLWTILHTAGNNSDIGHIGLYVNSSAVRERIWVFNFLEGSQASYSMTTYADITSGDTVETAIREMTTITFTLVAANSFMLVERM